MLLVSGWEDCGRIFKKRLVAATDGCEVEVNLRRGSYWVMAGIREAWTPATSSQKKGL